MGGDALPLLQPVDDGDKVVAAGSQHDLARLEGGAWRPLAHLPEAVEPVSLDVTPDGLVVVGTAGGAMLGFD